MSELGPYLAAYWQPLSGLIIGIVLVAFFLHLHLHRKQGAIRWIADNVFHNQFMAEHSAEGAFNVATSFVFTVGGLWIILAMLYLTN